MSVEGPIRASKAIEVERADMLPVALAMSLYLALAFPLRHWLIDDEPAERIKGPLALMVIAGGLFILMPSDWMPDRRFATGFYPAAFLLAGLSLSRFPKALPAVLIIAVAVSVYRLLPHYSAPPIPLAQVEDKAHEFSDRARALGLTDASVLLPDIGGALLASDIRVYDLAGLCDRTIAKASRTDKREFHNYIFDRMKPTFIRTHGFWADVAALDADPRFRRDYVPISEGIDPDLAEVGVNLLSGEYVRRDALGGRKPTILGHVRG